MKSNKKETCLACSCPCEVHTVHAHDRGDEHEHAHTEGNKCLACGGDKHAKHTCG